MVLQILILFLIGMFISGWAMNRNYKKLRDDETKI